MTADQYNRMADRLRDIPGMVSFITRMNRILTALGFIAYPALLLYIGVNLFRDTSVSFLSTSAVAGIIYYILGPGIAFMLLSIYRKIKNTPRPYEALDIRPILIKNSTGNSFPSRHIFSLMLIAVIWFFFMPLLSIFLMISTLVLALIRVVGGVHYIRDVIAGIVIGALAGVIISMIAILLFMSPV